MAKETGAIDKSLPRFLAKAYIFKEISDYSARPGADVTAADADDAIAAAANFIDCITALLAPR